ncbi:MAG: hypothetical protein H7833_12920 [Magnetococcus sp. DMHC-1]
MQSSVPLYGQYDFASVALGITNLPVVFVYLYIALRIARANNVVALIIFLHFCLVYITAMEFILVKFADQTHYTKAAWYYRSGIVDRVILNQHYLPSLIFALFPIPSVESIESVSMINVICYTYVYAFLVRKNILIGRAKWFYLLYPSLMVYSAMALRDGFIMVSMVVGVYFFLKKRYVLAFISHSILMIIKFQNFLIFCTAAMLFILTSPRVSILYRGVIILFVMLGAYYFSDFLTVNEINRYRRWMYFENHGGTTDGYIPVKDYFDVTVIGLMSAPFMIMRPFPWEAENLFQLFQSFENIFIDYLIFIAIRQSLINKNIRSSMWFVNLYFFVGMSIYGLVTDNFGTAARYKYPFVTFYLVFFLHYFEMDRFKRWMDRVQAYRQWYMAYWQQQAKINLPT